MNFLKSCESVGVFSDLVGTVFLEQAQEMEGDVEGDALRDTESDIVDKQSV